MISSRVITAPASEALSLSDAKAQLRILDDRSDWEIERFIGVATRWLEEGLGVTLITTQRGILLDKFPEDNTPIWIPRPPLVSVQAFTYYDSSNVQQTFTEGTHFRVVTAEKVDGMVYPIADCWPATKDRPDAIDIQYTAGFGANHNSVPEEAKHILRLLVAQWEEHRSPTIEGRVSNEVKIALKSLRQTMKHGFYAGAS